MSAGPRSRPGGRSDALSLPGSLEPSSHEADREADLGAVEEAVSPAPEAATDAAAWSLAKRFGFRLATVYFVLYVFPFPLGYVPWAGEYVERGVVWLWKAAAPWVAAHVLGLEGEMYLGMTGSGDTTFDYVRLLMMAVLAVAGAAVWSLADRRRSHYAYAARWLETGCRYYLGSVMLTYGILKVIPSQFTTPGLVRLLTAYGDSSPMGLLWTFMGASPAYTVFAGLGETVGGLLLFFKRTRLLGALIAIGVMSNVAMLNYAYDVPVKLFSTHLLLLAVGLAALDARRLAAFFVKNEVAPPALHPPLFRTRRLNLGARVLGLGLVGTVAWTMGSQGWTGYHSWGAGRPRPELWGIHDVESFVADGELLPPLLTDEVRWRTLVVDRALPTEFDGEMWPGYISIRPMEGRFRGAAIELDEEARTISRLPEEQKSVAAAREAGVEVTDVLRWDRPAPDRLVLRGTWDGREIEVHLEQRDLAEMELTGRGYHWINELPYNR